MAKTKLMCQTCANQVNGSYCTMGLEMSDKSRVYKKCNNYKVYVPKPKIVSVKRVRTDKTNYEGTDFGTFLRKGGHYSFRTGKYGVGK